MVSIIGKLVDFPEGSIKEVTVQGKPYAISNVNGSQTGHIAVLNL